MFLVENKKKKINQRLSKTLSTRTSKLYTTRNTLGVTI